MTFSPCVPFFLTFPVFFLFLFFLLCFCDWFSRVLQEEMGLQVYQELLERRQELDAIPNSDLKKSHSGDCSPFSSWDVGKTQTLKRLWAFF